MSSWAERRGKLGATRSTAANGEGDYREDTLTNAVFGALRYLPPSGALLALVERVVGAGRAVTGAEHFEMSFWPHLRSPQPAQRFVEPDVLIDTGTALICVEAKYKAAFGSCPRGGGGTWHQLSVQAEALVRHAAQLGGRKIVLVAVTHAAHAPDADLQLARQQMRELGIAPDQVTLTWLGWHHLAGVLAALDDLRPHEAALRADTLEYLSWRKVTVVTSPSAQQTGRPPEQQPTRRRPESSPAISTFQSILEALLAPNIKWGPMQRGVYLSTTTALDKAPDWVPGRVCLSWWPSAFEERSKRLVVSGFDPGMYTCFDFPAGRLEVGFAAELRRSKQARLRSCLHATSCPSFGLTAGDPHLSELRARRCVQFKGAGRNPAALRLSPPTAASTVRVRSTTGVSRSD